MAWRRTGDKTLSEPMRTQFTEAYMLHQGKMSEAFSLRPLSIVSAFHLLLI